MSKRKTGKKYYFAKDKETQTNEIDFVKQKYCVEKKKRIKIFKKF